MLRRSLVFFDKSGKKKLVKVPNQNRVFTMERADTSKPSRATAAIVSWLYAKPKTMKRYAEVYSEMGIDSVIVTCDWKHVMRPEEGRKLMNALEHEINTLHVQQAAALNTRSDEIEKNIVLHSFSMGAYMSSLWFEEMRKCEHKKTLSSIRCQLYDSPVDYDYVPYGVAAASFNNKTAISMMESTVTNFLKLFPTVRAEHIKASDRFWNDPVRAPSLWMYSKEDVISPETVCEKVMDNWKSDKVGIKDVRGELFKNTKHVCHMKEHPKQYKKAMVDFVNEHVPKNSS